MKLIPTSVNPVTITLYQGVPFSNNYEEHTLLSPRFKHIKGQTQTNVGNSKEAFLNMRVLNRYIYTRTTKTGTYNFAFGNGLVTSVVMELTDNEINSNYMKVTSGTSGTTDDYYYFITGITQKNEVTYLLNLELDVFMTFGEEFLSSIENKPVLVERKHCRRILDDGLSQLINPVCLNQESTFSQLKSNIIKQFTPLEFKDYINGITNYNDIMKEFNWIYIIVGKGSSVIKNDDYLRYQENGVSYPYAIFCLPTKPFYMRGEIAEISSGPTVYTTRSIEISPLTELKKFVDDTATQKIILSPFPPFKICDNLIMKRISGGIGYEMNWIQRPNSYNNTSYYDLLLFSGLTSNYYGTEFRVVYYPYTIESQTFYRGYIQILEGYGGEIAYKEVSNFFNTTHPTISNTRDTGEYKLQIAPFKDLRMSSYYGGEYRVPTQMLFLNTSGADRFNIKPNSIVTTNAESNSYFNYVYLNQYSVNGKIGLENSVSYNLPTGSNAELLFNQTQSEQYTNSKVVGAITNGLKVIGGALGVVFGGAMGKVGGAMAIASGVTGEINTFTDWSAKLEDLKNTPNSYTFGGSSYAYDNAIASSQSQTLLPYLITYGVTPIEEEMAGEFIYHYGYEYNAENYFNKYIYNASDNIFERRVFNYVKIREDITTKLVNKNLPLIVSQKINDVLNAGIKFWTFFAFDLTQESVVEDVLDNYFQKSKKCNAELVL